jgi:predicted ATPase/tetratricopeptide (TPR) repeat protein
LGQECEDHSHKQLETCVDCLYRLRQIVDLYQGDFLAGFGLDDSASFDEWRLWQQEHCLNKVLWALSLLADQALATGNGHQAEAFARRHIQLARWQEQPHRQVMRALAQQGKIAAALAHFDICQKILVAELGISPTAETIACRDQIRQQAVPHKRKNGSTNGQPSPLLSPPLPQPGTPFFGRTSQLAALSQRLLNPAHRLVTLVGAGGMGKTRLAIALAQQLQDQFQHGASFVPLAPVAEADEVVMVQVIAAALGYVFTGTHDPVTELLAHLRPRHHLLVLDNFEHLLNAAGLASRLLENAPHLTILATSRHPLDLPGEYVHLIRGLGLPRDERDAAATSVQFFAERASRSGSGFTLNSETLPTVTRICTSLDGWPLALELAATWINDYSPAEIEETLIQHLDQLRTHFRDVIERQKSMTAVLSWSYNLLSPQVKAVLANLSVFQGGWTPAAATVVIGATPASLNHLVQHAFVEQHPDGRQTMHELIRQFAQAHLPETALKTEPHSHYYLHWLKEQEPFLFGPEPMLILPTVRMELNNIRKAWHWAVKYAQYAWLNLSLAPLVRYYVMTGLTTTAIFDLGAAAESVEKADDPDHNLPETTDWGTKQRLALAGYLWAEQAFFYERTGAIEKATAAAERAWRLGQQTQDPITLSRSLCAQGVLLHIKGRLLQAREVLSSGAALAQGAGQERLAAECLYRLVRPKVKTDAYLTEARTIVHRLNDRWLKNEIARSSGGVAFYEGHLWQAYQYWQESLNDSRQFANATMIARLENNLGDLARRFGDYSQAFLYQNSALQTLQNLGDPVMEAHVLEGLSRLSWHTGRMALAWETIQQCEIICREQKINSCLGYLLSTKGRLHRAKGQIRAAQATFREAIACSLACSHPQMAMEAYAGLAEISYQQGNVAVAQAWIESILTFLAEGNVLEGFTETSWIYWVCYGVLSDRGDKRADWILGKAQAEIKLLAEQIPEGPMRQSYLTLPINATLLATNASMALA